MKNHLTRQCSGETRTLDRGWHVMLMAAIVMTTMAIPFARGASDKPVWVLERTVINSGNKDGRVPPGLAGACETGFTYTEKDPEGKAANNSMNWSAPPETIEDGAPVTLTLQASANPWANVSGWWNFSDYGVWSEWKGDKMVSSYEQGIKRSGTMTFKFKPSNSSEASIQISAGHDPQPDLWYTVTWVYKKRQPGAASTASDLVKDDSEDLCKEARDAWRAAAIRAKLAAPPVEMCRSMINELNQQWLNTRDSAYWNGTIDVAMQAGSLWSKPLSKWKWLQRVLGVGEAASQTAAASIMEAWVKGMIKQNQKEFNNICAGQGIQPSYVLESIANGKGFIYAATQLEVENVDPGRIIAADTGKGLENAGKKAFEKLTETILTGSFMRNLDADKIGAMLAMNPEGPRVDQTMGGIGADKPWLGVKEMYRKEFAAPVAQYLGVLISFQSTLDSAGDSHHKLESLRMAIDVFRKQEIASSANLEKLKQDLEVKLAAYQACLKLHGKTE